MRWIVGKGGLGLICRGRELCMRVFPECCGKLETIVTSQRTADDRDHGVPETSISGANV